MAKLKAPLLSLGAAGAIGKAVVFFPWKGIDVAREYVIPANPKSAPQLAQRGYLTEAVGKWHTSAYTAADVIAWNRYAGILAETMSGFNAFMRLEIARSAVLLPWFVISQIEVDTPTAVGFDVDVEDSIIGATLRAAIGVSKTHLPTLVALVDDADGTYSLTWAAGATKTDYYVRVDYQIAAVWYQRSGIYHVKTS